MDADILRLVLFSPGGSDIGIYFWDRHKKINLRVNAIHKAEQRQREVSSIRETGAAPGAGLG